MYAALLAHDLGSRNRGSNSPLYHIDYIAIPILAMFLMGAWTSRSAGCVINDYFDRSFDRSVERCKTRPLASGEVSVK